MNRSSDLDQNEADNAPVYTDHWGNVAAPPPIVADAPSRFAGVAKDAMVAADHADEAWGLISTDTEYARVADLSRVAEAHRELAAVVRGLALVVSKGAHVDLPPKSEHTLTPESDRPLSGAELIAAERQRQIDVEGYTPGHDAAHGDDELARAALAYLVHLVFEGRDLTPPTEWPWSADAWKPTPDPVHQLAKAGALIAAEIDRLSAVSRG